MSSCERLPHMTDSSRPRPAETRQPSLPSPLSCHGVALHSEGGTPDVSDGATRPTTARRTSRGRMTGMTRAVDVDRAAIVDDVSSLVLPSSAPAAATRTAAAGQYPRLSLPPGENQQLGTMTREPGGAATLAPAVRQDLWKAAAFSQH